MTRHEPVSVTDLDRAHAAMEAAPDDDAARLRFHAVLADSLLHLVLAGDAADGDDVTPEVFEVEGASFVLAFDSEERVADFTGRATASAALPGRALAQLLSGQGVGIALNPDVAPSAMLIAAEGVDWLAAMLAAAPAVTHGARPRELHAPGDLPAALLSALDAKLARAGGLAAAAWLAGVTHETGMRTHLVAFVDAAPGAEDTLARAVGEALSFSGVEAGTIDVILVSADDPVAARLARVGLRFDLPVPAGRAQDGLPPPGRDPGMDPDRPPRLR